MVADSITDSELFHGSPISRDFYKKRKTNWLCKLKQWKTDAPRNQWVYQWKRANVGEEENGSRLKYLGDKLTDKNTVSETFSYLEAWRIDYEEEGSYEDDDDDERASSASSPTSVLKNKDSGSNKSSEDCFCCSKQVTEEEEEDVFDDACDNWDGFRDALNYFGNEETDESPNPIPGLKQEEDPNLNTSKRKKRAPKNNRKQESSPQKAIQGKSKKKKKSKSEKKQQQEGVDDEKSECPICSEEMDETDLSFSPCPCGYQLCLFCHKRICEDDARCPSCRKCYDQTSNNNSGEVSFQQRGGGTLRLSPSFRGLDRA